MSREIISALLILVGTAMTAQIAAAGHQSINGVVIAHNSPGSWIPGWPTEAMGYPPYDGDIFPEVAYDLVTSKSTYHDAVIIDLRTEWEKNATESGCPMKIGIGMPLPKTINGHPYWFPETGKSTDKRNYQSAVTPYEAQTWIGFAWTTPYVYPDYPRPWTILMVMNPDFRNYINALEAEGTITKDTTIVTMCESGVRSPWAAILLKTMGYNSVYSMAGGGMLWNGDCNMDGVLTEADTGCTRLPWSGYPETDVAEPRKDKYRYYPALHGITDPVWAGSAEDGIGLPAIAPMNPGGLEPTDGFLFDRWTTWLQMDNDAPFGPYFFNILDYGDTSTTPIIHVDQSCQQCHTEPPPGS